jgi:hypothetical protein
MAPLLFALLAFAGGWLLARHQGAAQLAGLRVALAARDSALLVRTGETVALADRVLLIEDQAVALDLPIALPRSRARSHAAFGALEDQVLQRVLLPASTHAPTAWPAAQAAGDVRWGT